MSAEAIPFLSSGKDRFEWDVPVTIAVPLYCHDPTPPQGSTDKQCLSFFFVWLSITGPDLPPPEKDKHCLSFSREHQNPSTTAILSRHVETDTVGIASLARVRICNRRAKRTVARRDAARSRFHACEQPGSGLSSSSYGYLTPHGAAYAAADEPSATSTSWESSCLLSTAPAIQAIPYAVTSIVDGGGLMETW
ncbi:hypothetical protein K402DRAFT_397493 [Aulographum hederae CBS 113979]|uniref:Uncharacterized protein n=1 Tax=Aulographum hederae CBS 113979 TaxID=1176131 RepID=A0A6G1GP51_9PEZI|nr:hypothetical protein K402DRAFT_397493 [Aulographum hederae CBS 113979]